MNGLRLLRIVGSFALVFVLGGAAGWKLATSASVERAGVGSIDVSAQGALEKLGDRLQFTPEQKTRLLPLFMDWSRAAKLAGFDQRRRLELFEQNVPRIRETLGESQRREFERLVLEARERFGRRIQRERR